MLAVLSTLLILILAAFAVVSMIMTVSESWPRLAFALRYVQPPVAPESRRAVRVSSNRRPLVNVRPCPRAVSAAA